MTTIMSGNLDRLRSLMSGPVLGPDDDGYDQARSVWNGEIDRRPAVIARCLSPGDVSAAIGFAREEDLEHLGPWRRARLTAAPPCAWTV